MASSVRQAAFCVIIPIPPVRSLSVYLIMKCFMRLLFERCFIKVNFILRNKIVLFCCRKKGFDIKWVDDTHALGVFSSPITGIHPVDCCGLSLLSIFSCYLFLFPLYSSQLAFYSASVGKWQIQVFKHGTLYPCALPLPFHLNPVVIWRESLLLPRLHAV